LLFIVLLSFLVYAFAFFPLVMVVVSLFERRCIRVGEPSIAVLIPARNEESRIAAKIENTLASNYPQDKLSVFVASDGSSDGTVSVIKSFLDRGVRLIEIAERGGKTAAVNRLAEAADADILVFTDADVLVDPSALSLIASRFSDASTGAVCARRAVDSSDADGHAWMQKLQKSYETVIKRGEGVLGRVMGGDGSLYAVRKSCFSKVPSDVPDDFVSVLRVLKSGLRSVYEVVALAQEQMPDVDPESFSRRRRTVARGVRGLWGERALLNPFRFPLCALLLISHKILRWFGGCIMIALLLTNVVLVTHPVFRWLLLLQVVFYGFVGLSILVKGVGRRGLFGIIPYFVLSNLGATLGLVDVVLQRDWTLWQTQR